jgi:dTDP-4-amino-4,6-dideoxygalactose transaminase
LAAIPLSSPQIDERDGERVLRALKGRLSGNGPFCQRVEARLRERTRAPHALLTTSCTHAMELALLALGIGPGDEVVCPSFTFVSTANAVLRVGAVPVFADIEPKTLGLDPTDVARRIRSKTRALLPVHYAGIAADMDGLLKLAADARLVVVEDAAHGLAGSWRGRALGTLGDAGCYSFHETKNITCGEGGALLVRDPEVARRAEIIREKGTNRGAFLRGEVDKYTWVAEGSSYVLSDVLAALLDAQLDKLDEIQRRREHVCGRYRSELSDWARTAGASLPPELEERGSSHHIFYVLLRDAAARDRALSSLRADGIEASFHYVPLHDSPRGKRLHGDAALPVTESVAARLIRLPLHAGLQDEQVDRVVAAVGRLA